MRVIIQRITRASTGEVSVGKGLLALVGFHKNDKKTDAEWMANKMLKFFCWDAPDGRPWKSCVMDIDGEVLICLQPTIAEWEGTEELYNDFVSATKKLYKPEKVKSVAHGPIDFNNDGPITFTFDSTKKKD